MKQYRLRLSWILYSAYETALFFVIIKRTFEDHFIFWKMFLAHKQDLFSCLSKTLIESLQTETSMSKSSISCMLFPIPKQNT